MSLNTFLYPTQQRLMEVEQDLLPVLTADDPLFRIMPISNVDSHVLSWEQQDNYTGLQQVRGLGGAPSRVARVGGKRYTMTPGVYGEFIPIDEQELTLRRPWGSFSGSVDIADLVRRAQDQLLQRRLDRIRYIGWTLLTKGQFAVANDQTGVVHTDAFDLQNSLAAVDWSTHNTSTPLVDIRALPLLVRGTSNTLDSRGVGIMNQVTANHLIANTNADDIGGRWRVSLDGNLNLAIINDVLRQENLPTLTVYDAGYLDDSGDFQPYIPNGHVVFVCARPGGAPIAEYLMTRNANNPNMEPGAYTKVVDYGEERVPRLIEVHDGHNGGPAIYFPGAVIVLKAY